MLLMLILQKISKDLNWKPKIRFEDGIKMVKKNKNIGLIALYGIKKILRGQQKVGLNI